MDKERLISSSDAPLVVGLAVITILLFILGSWLAMTA